MNNTAEPQKAATSSPTPPKGHLRMRKGRSPLERLRSMATSPITVGLLVTGVFMIAAQNYYRIRSTNDSDRITNFLYDVVEIADLKSTDLRFKWRGEKPSLAQVALLAIDDQSVEQVGRWPWSREKTAHVIDEVFKYGAKAVALDMVFSEKQETPVADLINDLQKKYPTLPQQLKADLQIEKSKAYPDGILADIIAKYHDRIILGSFSNTDSNSSAFGFSSYQDYCRNEAFTRVNAKKFVKLNTTFIVDDGADDYVDVNFADPLKLVFDSIANSKTASFLQKYSHKSTSELSELESRQLQSELDSEYFDYCRKWLTPNDPFRNEPELNKLYTQLFSKTPALANKSFPEIRDIFTSTVASHPIPERDQWTINTDQLQNPADYTASFNAEQDQDGTIRKASLFFRTGNRIGTSFVPSLALQAYLIGSGYQARVEINRDPKNPQQKIMTKFQIYDVSKDPEVLVGDVPVDGQGRLRINYAGPSNTFPAIPAKEFFNNNAKMTISQNRWNPQVKRWQVSDFEVDKADFLKDKTLVFGATAVGIYDLRVTPFDKNFPGPETHVTTIANLLDRNFLHLSDQEPQWMRWVLCALGVIFSILISILGSVPGFALTLFAFTAIFAADWWLFAHGAVTTIVLPLFLLLMLFIILTFYKYFTEERKKKELRATFSKYVSPAIVDEILKDPQNIELGGQKVRMSVFFSDVRNFTTISEKLDPQILSDVLNEYLTPMTNIIFANKGTLDKYMGDAIMAFFGAPVAFADHAYHACRAALQSIEQLTKIQQSFASRNLPHIDIGIGINTAEMSVGNMGSEIVRNYTVMGDAVNLGSRLEGLNKEYGTRIILSEFTESDIRGKFVTREIDRVRVKGKKEPVRIFELMSEGAASSVQKQLIDAFTSGYRLYMEQRFQEALQEFTKAAAVVANDGPSLLFIDRCNDFIANPPPENWDGVFTMTKK